MLMGIKIAGPMKMVRGNAVFIREEAKLARNTHQLYILNAKLHFFQLG